MTLVPLDFSSRGHHFHDLDTFSKLDLTNLKNIGNSIFSF